MVLEESAQNEKVDDTGQELEGKGNMKQEEDVKNSRSPSIDNDTNSKSSKATLNSNSNSTFKGKKTNKQKNNTADLSKYFKKNK